MVMAGLRGKASAVRKWAAGAPQAPRGGDDARLPRGVLDGDVHHGLVQQLVGDLAERDGADDATGAAPLEPGVQVVQDAVAGERDAPVDATREARGELGDVVPDRPRVAVADAREHRRVETDLAPGLGDRLEAHVDAGPAVVRDEGQPRVEPHLADVLREVAAPTVDLDARRGEAALRE